MTQKPTRTCLIIATVLFSLGGLVGLLPALTSFFLFDAPGSDKNPATILLFCSAVTFPLLCLVSVVLSWILYARERFTASCWIAFLPVVNVVAGTLALLWLELFNNGLLS